jgi:hypothetical protein
VPGWVTVLDLPWWFFPLAVTAAAGPFVALGGHGAIAWHAIKRYYARIALRIQGMEDRATALEQQVTLINTRLSSLPTPPDIPTLMAQALEENPTDIGPAINEWLKSPEGSAAAGQFIKEASDAAGQLILEKLQGIAGGAARSADSKATALISGSIDFGNPVANGMWAMLPEANKRSVVSKVASILRKSSAEEVGAAAMADPSTPWWERT